MMTLLAAISGQTLVMAVVWVIIAAVLFFLLNWAIGYVGIAEPFQKVAKVIVVILVLVILVNALLMLVGQPFIRW